MGKTINGQLTSTYPVISFSSTGKDTVWFNGQDDLVYTPGQPVPVRYLQHDPTDARINTLYSLWIDVLIIAGVPCLMVLLIYLHRSIFPKGTKFLIGKKPFFQVIPVEGS
ncbi:DUF3592 domain-containing protein [Flavihumibacter profundi]|nr:DUF3592 domain-containing protein [Flavihumibacter profundi]MBZ5855584.1 DUF3592 domain-containing protein [Flavihumibacter profundi]